MGRKGGKCLQVLPIDMVEKIMHACSLARYVLRHVAEKELKREWGEVRHSVDVLAPGCGS